MGIAGEDVHVTSSMQEAIQSLERIAARCERLESVVRSDAIKNKALRAEVQAAIRDLDAVIAGGTDA
jgi:hypothetical protein